MIAAFKLQTIAGSAVLALILSGCTYYEIIFSTLFLAGIAAENSSSGGSGSSALSDDTLSGATHLTLNGMSDGKFESADEELDTDYWTICLPAYGELEVFVESEFEVLGQLEQNDSELAKFLPSDASPTGFIAGPTKVEAGPIFVQLQGRPESSYMISNDYSTSLPLDSGNDDPVNSMPFTIGATATSNIDHPGDFDYWSITIDERGHLIIDGFGAAKVFARLEDETGRVVGEYLPSQNQFRIIAPVYRQSSDLQTFRLIVWGQSCNDMGNYGFNSEFIPYDGNDFMEEAQTISEGTFTTEISHEIDVDFWRIDIDALTYLDLSTLGEFGVNATLFDDSGNSVEPNVDDSVTDDQSVLQFRWLGFMPAGTYYLKITRAETESLPRGQYSVSFSLATDLVGGEVIEAELNSVDDVDYFKYAASSDGEFQISFDSSVPIEYELLDESTESIGMGETALGSISQNFDYSGFLFQQVDRAEIYFVRVRTADSLESATYKMYFDFDSNFSPRKTLSILENKPESPK